MTKIRIQVLALLALTSTLTYAQEDNKKGYLTGSFETNTIYYKDDSKTEAESPEDHFGSNNYLKLDAPYEGETNVLHYLEVLRDEVGFDEIKKKVVNPLKGKKIGAYYGCLLFSPGTFTVFYNP